MDKRVAIRYCGGCNPRYNRSIAVENLRQEHNTFSLEVFNPNSVGYIGVLIICGCTAQCARQSDLPGGIPRFILTGLQALPQAHAFFSQL